MKCLYRTCFSETILILCLTTLDNPNPQSIFLFKYYVIRTKKIRSQKYLFKTAVCYISNLSNSYIASNKFGNQNYWLLNLTRARQPFTTVHPVRKNGCVFVQYRFKFCLALCIAVHINVCIPSPKLLPYSNIKCIYFYTIMLAFRGKALAEGVPSLANYIIHTRTYMVLVSTVFSYSHLPGCKFFK